VNVNNVLYDENESDLLQRVAAGNEHAFRLLVEKYSGLLYKFIHRHTNDPQLSEEIVQDIFIKIWQTRETLTGLRSFRAFLLVVSRNHVLNTIKKMMREKKKQWEWQKENTSLQEEDQQELEEVFGLIDDAVNRLPPQQKRVWILSRREGLKYEQIAAEMNISKDAVKKYLQYANGAIKDHVINNINIPLLVMILSRF
jgi:RNA polymerase sigma-70 factor (family 1)